MFNHSCIKTINANALAHFSWVVALDLTDNYIEVLRVKNFPNLAHLKKLILTSNRVRNIEDRSFNGLPSGPKYFLELAEVVKTPYHTMTSVLASLRSLQSFTVHGYKYAGLNSLRVLRLDHNQLESISNVTFSGLPSLKQLTLSHNKLHSLPHKAFRNLPNLKALDVSGNQLAEFLPDHVVRLSNLESLNISGNQLTTYDSHIYLEVNRIKKLDLSNNSIGCIAADAFDKKNLNNIDISNNPLKRPHYKWFRRFRTKTSVTFPHQSFILSKSGAWICDCTVYFYKKFLKTLSEKWQENLDIECSEPPNLRGLMLSKVGWHQLSLQGNCSAPDNYDPCPNLKPIPTTSSTTKTTPTTARVTTSFNRDNSSPTNTIAHSELKLENPLVYIALISVIVVLAVCVFSITYYAFNCESSYKNKKVPKQLNHSNSSLGSGRSSRADSESEVSINEASSDSARYPRPPPSGRSTTSVEVENDQGLNPCETRVHRLAGSAASTTGSESTHGYASINHQNPAHFGPRYPPPRPPRSTTTTIPIREAVQSVPMVYQVPHPNHHQQAPGPDQQTFLMMPGYLNTSQFQPI